MGLQRILLGLVRIGADTREKSSS